MQSYCKLAGGGGRVYLVSSLGLFINLEVIRAGCYSFKFFLNFLYCRLLHIVTLAALFKCFFLFSFIADSTPCYVCYVVAALFIL